MQNNLPDPGKEPETNNKKTLLKACSFLLAVGIGLLALTMLSLFLTGSRGEKERRIKTLANTKSAEGNELHRFSLWVSLPPKYSHRASLSRSTKPDAPVRELYTASIPYSLLLPKDAYDRFPEDLLFWDRGEGGSGTRREKNAIGSLEYPGQVGNISEFIERFERTGEPVPFPCGHDNFIQITRPSNEYHLPRFNREYTFYEGSNPDVLLSCSNVTIIPYPSCNIGFIYDDYFISLIMHNKMICSTDHIVANMTSLIDEWREAAQSPSDTDPNR